jgi:hypothetical protein
VRRVTDTAGEEVWDVVADNSVDVVYNNYNQPGNADKAMRKLKSGGYYISIIGGLAKVPKAGVTQEQFLVNATRPRDLVCTRTALLKCVDKHSLKQLPIALQCLPASQVVYSQEGICIYRFNLTHQNSQHEEAQAGESESEIESSADAPPYSSCYWCCWCCWCCMHVCLPHRKS